MSVIDYEKKSNLAYKASLLGYGLQYLLIIISTLWLVPTHKEPNLVICILSMLPLLVIFPWIIKRSIRAHIWLCFLMLGYFLPAVLHAFMYQQYGWLPFVEITNTAYLFIAAMMFARWEQKRYCVSITR